MKNKQIIVFVFALVLILGILFGLAIKDSNIKEEAAEDNEELILNKAIDESESVTDEEKGNFSKINVDEYLEIYSGENPTIIFVGRSGCRYCAIAEPILQKLVFNNNLDIKYLSTDDFDAVSESKFINSNSQLSNFVTPLVMVVSNNDINDAIEGLTDTEGYTSFFRNNGFIK